EIEHDRQKKHTIEVVVDRLVIPKEQQQEIDPSFRQRVTDSLETALKLGSGIVQVAIIGGDEILFSERLACVSCGISLPEIAPHTFSFNSPHGACPTCAGLGVLQTVDPEQMADQAAMGIINRPLRSVGVQGTAPSWGEEIESSVSVRICPDCRGTRLKPEALSVTVGGRNIAQVTQLSIEQAQRFFQLSEAKRSAYQFFVSDTQTSIDPHELLVEVALTERERLIARQLLKEISVRLQFLLDMG